MKLSIKGSPKNTKKSSVRYAAKFFADELFSKRLNRALTVNISFDPYEVNEIIETRELGACVSIEDVICGRPRQFEIFIRHGLSKANIYKVLAHEMRHVYQYARSRLYDYERSERVRWKRKIYKNKVFKNKKAHNSKPWEIDANKYEHILINALHKHCKEKFG